MGFYFFLRCWKLSIIIFVNLIENCDCNKEYFVMMFIYKDDFMWILGYDYLFM